GLHVGRAADDEGQPAAGAGRGGALGELQVGDADDTVAEALAQDGGVVGAERDEVGDGPGGGVGAGAGDGEVLAGAGELLVELEPGPVAGGDHADDGADADDDAEAGQRGPPLVDGQRPKGDPECGEQAHLNSHVGHVGNVPGQTGTLPTCPTTGFRRRL